MVKEGRKYILELLQYIVVPKTWWCKKQLSQPIHTQEVLKYLLEEGALLTELPQPHCSSCS